ncbi:MAG: YhdP family protein, partial [Gammaproteobacteria bacterium]
LPRLTIERLRIDGDDGTPALEAGRVTAVISPRSLFARAPRLALLELESPSVRIERIAPGRIRVAGIELAPDGAGDGAAFELLAGQRRIVVRGAAIDWRDAVLGVRERVSGVDAAIGSVGRRHRVSLAAAALPGAWEGLSFAAEIYRAPGRAVADWRRWQGDSYLQLSSADAAAASRMLPAGALALARGRGDLKAWMEFDAGRAVRVDLKTSLEDLEWRLPGGSLRLAGLETELVARAAGEGHDLAIGQLRLVDPAGLAFASMGEQRLRLDRAGAPVAGRIAVKPFEAADALAFARGLPLDPVVLARVQALGASGRVASASGEWDRAAGLKFSSAIDFEGLSLRYAPGAGSPDEALPWFANLSGQARITQSGGELRLRAADATLGFPGIFEAPEIVLAAVSGQASWTVGAALAGGEARPDASDAPAAPGAAPGAAPAAAPALPPIEVTVEALRFENQDAAGVVGGRWRNGGKGAGVVDIEGRLDRARADRVVRYLPRAVPAEVREWVGAAVVGGRSDDVRFRLRGDLEDFPFVRPADGEFSVEARLSGATLRYAPDWPAIEGFEGRLLFERNGMRVDMRSGRVFGVALAETRAVLEDFGTPLLVVEGAGEGPATEMIRFVNESPLATRIDDFTRDTAATGRARLKLRLDLPLDDLDGTRVAGRVQFLGNELTLDDTLPVFSGVTGALEFTERGMALRELSATFLGGPLRVSGETPEPGRFTIRGDGRIAADGMRLVADNPLTRALSGETGYRVLVDVARRASTVTVESDLVGIASSLPAPLGKPAGEPMRLRVETRPQAPADPQARPSADAIRAELGEGLRLVLERERDPATQMLLVRRGALALDAEPVLPATGLAVQLQAPEVDLDAWTPVFAAAELGSPGAAQGEGFAQGFSLLPGTVSVVADRVRVAGRTLNEVTLGASRAGDYWRANIGAREVQGYFSWRAAAAGQRMGTLTARFTRLEIARSRAGEVESLLDASPSELPGLDVAADEFVLFDRRLGSLSLRATNSPGAARPAWTLERLRIEHPAAAFSATGGWAPVGFGRGRATRLDFELDLKDSGRLLALFGIEDAVRGGAGRIAGDLHWSGSPLALDYATLGGSMALAVGKGQFLKTDPGIAKLIGVLNLQSLPRRLALDFRDVFAEGFAFDEISGGVGISAGVARTEDLVMRGVQARVNIHGSADLEEETQALEVEVRPELNAGLASLAYGAMVNPVIGLGSFVAQMALRAPIQQIFSYEYEITGPWADPKVVEKRRRVEPAPLPATGP